MNQRFLLAGGPGAGKTTTLAVLRSRGFECVPDAARSIIEQRLKECLTPRPEPPEFARSLLSANIEQYDRILDKGQPVFFDFSIVESLMMMRELHLLTPAEVIEHLRQRPYNQTVFFFPPWEAIYVQDTERDQTYADSVKISDAIRGGFESLGFHLQVISPASPEGRADQILASIQIDENSRQNVGMENVDWRAETLALVRTLINQADPDMVEEVKWVKASNPGGVPVWSLNGIICTGETYKDKVKFTFAKGASLPDPTKLFNSSLEGGTRRAIDLFEDDKLDEEAFKALIRAAVNHNSSSKGKQSES